MAVDISRQIDDRSCYLEARRPCRMATKAAAAANGTTAKAKSHRFTHPINDTGVQ